MENYLLNYDENTGEIKGFYLPLIHGDNIPSPVIEITPEKHKFYMENQGKYRINPITMEDELIPITGILQPEPTIETRINLIQQALDDILLGGGL